MDRELEITPSPSRAERAAIAAALDSVLAEWGAAPSGDSRWAIDPGASLQDGFAQAWPALDPAQATARRPRRRFGATRA